MSVPTIDEVQKFMKENESFFKMPLPDYVPSKNNKNRTTQVAGKGLLEFMTFYKEKGLMSMMEEYSNKLEHLLLKYKVNEKTQTPVLDNWLRGDFSPALEHEEIRKFLIDNKDHIIIDLWRKRTKIQEKENAPIIQPISQTIAVESVSTLSNKNELSKSPEQQPVNNNNELLKSSFTKQPVVNRNNKLLELTEKFLSMLEKDFNKLFSVSNSVTRNNNIEISRNLINEGVTGDLFKSQQGYDEWKTEVVSSRKNQAQMQSPSLSSLSEQQAVNKNNKLSVFREKFLAMPEKEFNKLFSISNSVIMNNNIMISRNLNNEGVTGDLFKSQQEYDKWKTEVVSARKTQAQMQSPSLSSLSEQQAVNKNNKLSEFREKFLAMPEKEFNKLFSMSNTVMKDNNIIMPRKLVGEGVSGDLFKTQKEYEDWKTEVVSARKNQAQMQSPSLSSLSEQQAVNKNNKLSEFREKFLAMPEKEFNKLFSMSNTVMKDNNIIIPRKLVGEGVSGDLFKTQKEYEDWKTELVSARNNQDQTHSPTVSRPVNQHTDLSKLRAEFLTKPDNRVLHSPFDGNLDKFVHFKKSYGEFLNGFILSNFQSQIKKTSSKEELEDLVQKLKLTDEYKVLTQATSGEIKSSSPDKTAAKAFNEIVDEQKNILSGPTKRL